LKAARVKMETTEEKREQINKIRKTKTHRSKDGTLVILMDEGWLTPPTKVM